MSGTTIIAQISVPLTNSVDPDEMWHNATFHLGLQCLQKYTLRKRNLTCVSNYIILVKFVQHWGKPFFCFASR